MPPRIKIGIFTTALLLATGCSAQTKTTIPAQATNAPEIIADNLEIPWEIAFMPGGGLLVTERPGTLIRIDETRQRYEISGVRHIGEGGLLGIALHPEFSVNRFIYLYLTTQSQNGLSNRIERYRLDTDKLTDRKVILFGIPGAVNHDGGRMEFGPDGYLYVTTGDAGKPDLAQNTKSLAGKILRIADDGSIPEDNPFDNEVYSLGHRNPQGLAWDDKGRLWSTEHGRSGVQSGLDELNLIEKGANYGWPEIQGSQTRAGMRSPVLHSGANETWAPASAAYLNGSVFFGGPRGATLYEAVLTGSGNGTPELKKHYSGEFGRLRTVRVGPDGFLYLTTSNRDGRGKPQPGDDKIIRIKVD